MTKTNDEVIDEFLKIAVREYVPREWYCPVQAITFLKEALTLKDTQHEEEMREKLKVLEAKVAERVATTFHVNTYADGNRIFTEGALAVVDIARELLTPKTPDHESKE